MNTGTYTFGLPTFDEDTVPRTFHFPEDIMAGFDKRGENRGTHSGLVSETAVINGKEVKMSEW